MKSQIFNCLLQVKAALLFPLLSSPLTHAAQFPFHCANAGHSHRTLQESRRKQLLVILECFDVNSLSCRAEYSSSKCSRNEQLFLKQPAAM